MSWFVRVEISIILIILLRGKTQKYLHIMSKVAICNPRPNLTIRKLEDFKTDSRIQHNYLLLTCSYKGCSVMMHEPFFLCSTHVV